tara:strand:+ start:11455 stop:13095 length:1641 start_codon:yes stop_codon:yes gene_type:complete
MSRQMTGLSSACVAVLAVVALSGCGIAADEDFQKGRIGYVSGALGVISSEEPQAALIARDVLSAGGTAADAAVAMGFAMAVTMPSSASLGGGGVCIARDARGDVPTVFDFLPRAPKVVSPGTARPSAVPASPRGLFLLHSRFGNLSWSQVVAPSENLARFGFNVPRATATKLEAVADSLLQDAAAAQVFRRADGAIIGEGDFLVQPDLAAVLARIRNVGVGEIYVGPGAQNLADAVIAAGGSLSIEDLRDYRPALRAPISFNWEKNTTWHFAGPPTAGGAVAAEMLALLLDGDRFENADPLTREHLLAEAAKLAFADRMRLLQADGAYSEDPQSLLSEAHVESMGARIDDDAVVPLAAVAPTAREWPETPDAVSFAVMDVRGGAVACTLTMNNLFGTGRMASGFGIMLAAAPDSQGRTYTPLGPALLTSEFHNHSYLAAAASGGVAAPTAMINVIARAAAGPQTLRDSMRAPRTHYAGVPDKVFVEADMPNDIVDGLRKLGHDVAVTESIGRAVVVYCPSGIPNDKGVQCNSAAERRGHGIALGGN